MRNPFTGLSIRARLVLGMVLLVLVGLTVVNVSGVLLMRSYLLDRVDAQVSGMGPAVSRPPDAPRDLCANRRDPRGLRSDFVLLVLDADGKVECSLGPDLGRAAPNLTSATHASDGRLATIRSLDGSSRWRVRTVHDDTADRSVVLAVSLADADATVSRLTWLSLLVSGIVLVLTAIAAWAIARLGLQPLKQIEATAERIAAGDLSERVPAYRSGTEVGRLALALNGMLVQIEHAFSARAESETRLRRFISDASHELRTPLAAIRGHAEMWRSGISQDPDTGMSRIEAESARMGDLVNDMLLLARLDQSRPLELKRVDLLSLATDAVVDARVLQPGRQISISPEHGRQPPVVLGDESRLRQVLGNLMSNAISHTPPESPIEVSVRTEAAGVVIRVVDGGPGMAPDVVTQAFDRFYRADSGRTRSHGGTGLGLAIVASLVEAHGGTVTCTSSVEHGTAFCVSLPHADAS